MSPHTKNLLNILEDFDLLNRMYGTEGSYSQLSLEGL